MKKLIFILLLTSINLLIGQNIHPDTLQKWSVSQNDSLKSVAFNFLSRKAIFIKPDSGEKIARKAVKFAKKYGSKDLESRALISVGVSYGVRNDYNSALKYFLNALTLAEEIKDSAGVSAISGNIGVIYKELEQNKKALEYFDMSANMEFARGQYNSPYVASAKINSAQIYDNINEKDMAMKYTKEAIQIYIVIGNKRGLGRAYHSLASLYNNIDIDSALVYNHKSIEIKNEVSDNAGLVSSYNNLGYIYLKKGKINLAEKSCLKSYELTENKGLKNKKADCAFCLAKVYKAKNNFKKAYQYLEESKDLKDSIFHESKVQEITEVNMKYQMQKQHLKDSLTTAKHDAINSKIIENQKLKTEKRNLWIIGISLVLIISIIGIYLLFKSNKFKQKTNELISEKNEELNQQNEEILTQRDELDRQRKVLENKNYEIRDSIIAAERIQNAFFTYENEVSNFLPNHFIFFKPLDIVSGDFYWMYKYNELIYLAVVDCTGHGVPGAFMSLLGASSLNEIVNNNPKISPAEILNLLRSKIIMDLNQNSEITGGQEGMDLSLICINRNRLEVQFSGANNPLYLIKKESNEIDIIKGDRQPIGISPNPTPFTNHTIKLNEGDQLYLFSDGYADQFGGEKNKKFGYKRLRSLLLSIKDEDLNTQKQKIETTFTDWIEIGKDEQIDDVCLIGIRF